MNPETFNRWVIEGTLTTNSPLHIGTGTVVTSAERGNIGPHGKKGKRLPQIAAVATDHNGQAYVPGSVLRNFVRRVLRDRVGLAFADSLLGTQEAGGRIDARDAFVRDGRPGGHPPPFWCGDRLTGIAASVAIDRRTRAARDKFLAFREFVPAGVPFGVRLCAEDVSEDEIVSLLAAMRSFQDSSEPRTIGAHEADGWGRCLWDAEAVHYFDRTHVADWIANPERGVGFAAAPALPHPDFTMLLARAERRFDQWTAQPRRSVRLHVTLTIEEDFVVRDPSVDGSRAPHFVPVRDASGRPFLPAESFRGLFRSQAERIIRTRGADACHGGSGCAPVRRRDEVTSRCLPCGVFGTSGWRSPLRISDFTSPVDVATATRHLVAVDRFTGGLAGPRKFEGEVAVRPTFLGTIDLCVDRLIDARMHPHALGLLALALRDLEEGDLGFGQGTGRNWGAAHAVVTGASLPTADMPPEWSAGLAAFADFAIRSPMSDDAQAHLAALVEALPGQPAASPGIAPRVLPGTAPVPPPPAPQLAVAGANRFCNPYHFVPLHGQTWGYDIEQWRRGEFPHVGHDRYVPGTWSGRLICRLTTKTPLVVGAGLQPGGPGQPQRVIPCEDNGVPAIPGSSLRGLISSTAEAASNSALRVLHDTRYSYRKKPIDALSAMGRMRVGSDAAGRRVFELQPLTYPTLAGNDMDGWTLPAKWARVFQSGVNLRVYLQSPGPARGWTGPRLVGMQVPFMDLPVASDGKEVHMGPGSMAQRAGIKFKTADNGATYLLGQVATTGVPLAWPVSPASDPEGFAVRGYLYVMSAPNRQIIDSKKYETFIPVPEEFDDEASPGCPVWRRVPDDVVARFNGLMAAVAATSRANETPRPYEPLHTRQGRTPSTPDVELEDGDLVYFDVDEHGQVSELSWSAVWRQEVQKGAQARGSSWAFFNAVDPELLPFSARRRRISLAEAIFGLAVDDGTPPLEEGQSDNGLAALAGRVRVARALATARPADGWYETGAALRMMTSPKPPSPALYFKRTANGRHPTKQTLRPRDHHPQGRKVYLHHAGGDGWQAAPATVNQSPQLHSHVTPVRRGLTYYFHVDVENFSSEELDLLCYALRPTAGFRHKLGMGKSTPLGSVQIDVVGGWRVDRVARYTGAGLFAPRYAAIHAGDLEMPGDLTRYTRERQAAADIEAGAWPTERSAAFRAACPPLAPVRRALEMLGESAATTVHWPVRLEQAVGQQHFRWFVENDKRPMNQREVLTPLIGGTTDVSLKKL